MTAVRKWGILPMLCKFKAPLNLISKVSDPMLKLKEPDGLLWNFFSMSELFTGPVFPFESCPQKLKIIRKWTKKTNNYNHNEIFGPTRLLVNL